MDRMAAIIEAAKRDKQSPKGVFHSVEKMGFEWIVNRHSEETQQKDIVRR